MTTRIHAQMIAIKIALTLPVTYALTYPIFNPTAGGGIFMEVAHLGPKLSALIALGFLLAVFLYCKDLGSVLRLVRPAARLAPPKSVWKMFLLPYNFVEDFFIVVNVAGSIRTEAKSNAHLSHVRSGGLISGLAWCSAQILSLIPSTFGAIAGIFALLFWVIHWRCIRLTISALKRGSSSA